MSTHSPIWRRCVALCLRLYAPVRCVCCLPVCLHQTPTWNAYLIHFVCSKLTNDSLFFSYFFSSIVSFAWEINTRNGDLITRLPTPSPPKDKDTLSFLVTIKDKVDASGGDSEHDNLVEVPIKVIVLDENDVRPEFQNVSLFDECHSCSRPIVWAVIADGTRRTIRCSPFMLLPFNQLFAECSKETEEKMYEKNIQRFDCRFVSVYHVQMLDFFH